jgi:plastocyanin
MKRVCVIALVFGVFAAAGCKKKDKPAAVHGKQAPGAAAGSIKADPADLPGADGARRVDITVTDTGFDPASVAAKAGEKLTLVFTRTTTSPCGGEVVLKSTGEKKELPLNEPVELAVVTEKPGELAFSCGMDMMQGSIVVQ